MVKLIKNLMFKGRHKLNLRFYLLILYNFLMFSSNSELYGKI